jgi:MarR family transcriptional regulator for hemolysin
MKTNRQTPFDPLGRQINVTARATRALLDAVLAEADTTFSSWLVLAALNARGPAIQKDLARELDMIGPSVVERIDQLEAAGHVARSAVPGDRRATEAALTAGLAASDVLTTRRVLTHIAERAKTLR